MIERGRGGVTVKMDRPILQEVTGKETEIGIGREIDIKLVDQELIGLTVTHMV